LAAASLSIGEAGSFQLSAVSSQLDRRDGGGIIYPYA